MSGRTRKQRPIGAPAFMVNCLFNPRYPGCEVETLQSSPLVIIHSTQTIGSVQYRQLLYRISVAQVTIKQYIIVVQVANILDQFSTGSYYIESVIVQIAIIYSLCSTYIGSLQYRQLLYRISVVLVAIIQDQCGTGGY